MAVTLIGINTDDKIESIMTMRRTRGLEEGNNGHKRANYLPLALQLHIIYERKCGHSTFWAELALKFEDKLKIFFFSFRN